MAKKTQNQGQAPVPMQGDEAEITAQYTKMVGFFNGKKQQKGHIKGRSPNEAFASFIQDAERPWGAIVLDPREFALAFGPDEWRVVQPGGELHIRNRIMAQRNYTIVGHEGGPQGLEIAVRREEKGLFSRWLFSSDETTALRAAEPAGSLHFGDDRCPIVCIVGGIDVTLAVALARAIGSGQLRIGR